jgi:hypothetical protein
MNTIFNIFADDKIKSTKEDRFIKLEITHINCQEPFLEIYVHQNKVSDIIYSMNELQKDTWGRISGLHYKSGVHIKNGWYYKEEFIAYELREAYRIIRDRLKSEGV